jgi:hypothetical protein
VAAPATCDKLSFDMMHDPGVWHRPKSLVVLGLTRTTTIHPFAFI